MVSICLRSSVVVVVVAVLAGGAVAAEPRPGLAAGAWKLESLRLHDGRRLEGLVVDPTAAGEHRDPTAPIGFVQIVQPPGRMMELITWAPISAARIAAIEPLPAAEHALLAKRVDEFRNRRGRQHAAETAVTLVRDDGDEAWRYAGRWFAMRSTADPSLTRKAVVLLEQVFAALEALVPLPPTVGEGSAPLLLVTLCGTAAEYRGVQETLGIAADHPALYVPARGQLVAGSDLPAMIEQERTAADSLALTEREIVDRDRSFEVDVRRLAVDLEKQGIPAGKRAEVVHAARSRWQRERDEMLAQVIAARRDNAANVADARRAFAARLTHEAWHAYANRRLVASGRRPLPLWLDEGLAQVFETAPLEAGELRLDAPDPVRLKALEELLAGRDAPPLVDLLRAGQSQFLIGHAGGRKASQESYLMAWGLAFHLAVLEPVLTPTSLAAICEPAAGADESARVVEFERLVGMPIAEFDAAWRRRMLALRPR
jgi:hypothetical protein